MKLNNNILGLLLLAATLLSSCAGEEDNIFSESAAQRLVSTAAKGEARLMSATDGWAMEYYPTTDTTDPYGLGYLLLTKFNADGSALVAMKNTFSSNAYLEDTSAWEIVTDNGVVLTYNTYNKCIHAFSDPEDLSSTSSTDETGYGCEGDYEFIMVDITDDETPEYLTLKGKKRGVYVRLSRLESGTDFQEYIEDVQAFNNTVFSSSAPNYLVLTLGDSIMQVDDMATGIPNIYPWGSDAITNESYHPYLLTKHDGQYRLRFRDEMTSTDGSSVQEFYYDEAQDCFLDINNSANTLCGANAADFFVYEIEDGNSWTLRRSSDMGTTASTLFENVYSGFSAMSYTLQYVRFMLSGNDLVCAFTVKNSKNATTTVSYKLAYTQDGDNVTFAYTEPLNTSSTTVYNSIAAIGDFLSAVSATATISAATTLFNLSSVKLNFGGDLWFAVSL